MPQVERMREVLTEPLTPAYVERKSREGWKPVAVVWERPVEGDAARTADIAEDVPYGVKISENCLELEAGQSGEGSLARDAGNDHPGPASFGNCRVLKPARISHPPEPQVDARGGLRFVASSHRSRPQGFYQRGVGSSTRPSDERGLEPTPSTERLCPILGA